MPLPLIAPPEPETEDGQNPDWSGVLGAPSVNNRLPVSPGLTSDFAEYYIENLITNPSVETNLTGWSAGADGAWLNGLGTATRVAGGAVGGFQIQMVTTAAAPYQGIGVGSIPSTVGKYYTAGVAVKGNAGGELVEICLARSGSGTGSTILPVNLTTSWQYLWIRYLAIYSTMTFCVRNNAATAMTYFVDAAMVTESPVKPAVYVDGSQPDCYWTGTAHASTSRKRVQPYNGTLDYHVSWSAIHQITNLITNPSIETDTTGWSEGAGGSVSRSTAQALRGSASLLIDPVNAQTIARVDQAGTTLAVGKTYSALWAVRVPTAGNYYFQFQAGNGGGGNAKSTGAIALAANTWTWMEVEGLAITVANPAVFALIRATGTWGTETPYADGFMVVESATIDAYFDGSDYDCYWTGTPHLSASRNQVGDLSEWSSVSSPNPCVGVAREFSHA